MSRVRGPVSRVRMNKWQRHQNHLHLNCILEGNKISKVGLRGVSRRFTPAAGGPGGRCQLQDTAGKKFRFSLYYTALHAGVPAVERQITRVTLEVLM